jgi:hypothetical protein
MRGLRRRSVVMIGLLIVIGLAIASAWLLGPKELAVTFLRFEDGEWGKRWAVWRLGNATGETVFCRQGVYQAQSPDGWRDYPIPSRRNNAAEGSGRIRVEGRHYDITVKSGTDWDVATSLKSFDGLARTTPFRVSFAVQRPPPRWLRALAKEVPWLVPTKVLQSRDVAVWSEVVMP